MQNGISEKYIIGCIIGLETVSEHHFNVAAGRSEADFR